MDKEMNCMRKIRMLEDVEIHEYIHSAAESVLEARPCWYQQNLPGNLKYVHYYKSGWGNEFRHVKEEVGKSFLLESTLGRSSAKYHPYIVIEDIHGNLYSYSLFYSGNWRFTLENKYDSFELEIGFEESFYTAIKQGEIFTTPKIGTLASSRGWRELRGTWQRFSDQWMKKNDLQHFMPVAWNHWWAYEDANINEKVFLDNAKKAAELGVDICVLDAGWFGNNQHWFDVRGDWEDIDAEKFPNGIVYLSEKVHEMGMKFGFWMEIEGLGKQARLAEQHPEFVARKGNESLDYICFGNPKAVDWAVETLSKIIETYKCEWIKFDFNLDPRLGCGCTEHGHGVAEGLFAHCQGLYRFFSILNEKYPEVVFENCSSGGQRTDFGILENMHVTFLSDPDYPEHKKRCIRNAGQMLASNRMYHFMPSHTCGSEDARPFPSSDLAAATPEERKYFTRLGMLTAFGISHRLVDYNQEIIDFLKQEITLFKQRIKPFIQQSVYQTAAKGDTEFHIYQKGDEYLVMAFSTAGTEEQVDLAELGIPGSGLYSVEDIDSQNITEIHSGKLAVSFKSDKAKSFIIKKLPTE